MGGNSSLPRKSTYWQLVPSEAGDWQKQTDLESTFNMLLENKEAQIPWSLDKQHIGRGEQVCVCKPERGPKARSQGCDVMKVDART